MCVLLHMLPIKNGDATLIVDYSGIRPYFILIDAGLADNEVLDYILNVGIYHIDLVVLSHPDVDHTNGFLALINSKYISIGQVWCFDLSFLRNFVETGILKPPKNPTYEIFYDRMLLSLVVTDKILTELAQKKVKVLQVSSGYRLNIGNLHLEVLYPWDGFYKALEDPNNLKKLLSKKWPAGWQPSQIKEAVSAKKINVKKRTKAQEQKILEELLDLKKKNDIEGITLVQHDVDKTDNLTDNKNYDDDQIGDDSYLKDSLPVSLIGTLYNNLSIVLKIYVLGGLNPPTMLFPGDLTDWTYLFIRRLNDLPSDILKYPHHGSAGKVIKAKKLQSLHYCIFYHCKLVHRLPCCQCHYCLLEILDQVESDFFSKTIRPNHTIIYPYPRQGLPKAGVVPVNIGQLYANREQMDAANLADPNNLPVARILRIGTEAGDIQLIS